MAYPILGHAVERVGVKSAKRTRSWLWSIEPPHAKSAISQKVGGVAWVALGWVWLGSVRGLPIGESEAWWLEVVIRASCGKQASSHAVLPATSVA